MASLPVKPALSKSYEKNSPQERVCTHTDATEVLNQSWFDPIPTPNKRNLRSTYLCYDWQLHVKSFVQHLEVMLVRGEFVGSQSLRSQPV